MPLDIALPTWGSRPSSTSGKATAPHTRKPTLDSRPASPTKGQVWEARKLWSHNTGQTLPWDQLDPGLAHWHANTTFGTPQTPYPTVAETVPPPPLYEQSETSSGMPGPCSQTPGTHCQLVLTNWHYPQDLASPAASGWAIASEPSGPWLCPQVSQH